MCEEACGQCRAPILLCDGVVVQSFGLGRGCDDGGMSDAELTATSRAGSL